MKRLFGKTCTDRVRPGNLEGCTHISKSKRTILLGVLLICVVVTNGCSGKAQALRIAVEQFKVESIAAVDAIDTMRQKELAPLSRTQAEVSNTFVDNVLQSERPATVRRITLWRDPEKSTLSPQIEEAWTAFLDELRLQYTTFAAIFDQIEQASFTGREIVAKAQPYIEKLTAQLAHFARHVEDNPPRRLQRRSGLLLHLESIRKENISAADKRRQIALWLDAWIALETAENELKRTTVEQCLKAVIIGQEIRSQILRYDRLSLGDISEAATKILGLAGSVTGKDFGQIQTQLERVMTTINNDPVWKTTVEAALQNVNKAIDARSRPDSAAPKTQ